MKLIQITAFPEAIQNGCIEIPEELTTLEEIRDYVKDHWDDINFDPVDLYYDKIPFNIDTDYFLN